MKVFVIGLNGIGLMPTTPRKARILLRNGKAVVYSHFPFTIKLNYKTGSATQETLIGVDTGEQHIGIGIVINGEAVYAADVELRKSMEKRRLMEARRMYRRSRRYRKTRYRYPKFRFHTKRVYQDGKWVKLPNAVMTGRPEGWLPPSIQSKVDHHIRIIRRYLEVLPKNTHLTIEAAKFDIARMKDPEVHGSLYQEGRLSDYENVKSYVLAKFGYTCPICKHKFDKEHKPKIHHISMRKYGATDNPDEFAPVCEKCHTTEAHKAGGVLDKLRLATKRKEYREPIFMNILRKQLFKAFPDVQFTYGNITSADRMHYGIEKSHANDAITVAVAGRRISKLNEAEPIYIKQVRKKKRSLHEAVPRKGRKEPNRAAKRNCRNVKAVGNFTLYDTVNICATGEVGFISGFTGKAAYVQNFEGKYILPIGKKYKQHNLSGLKVLRSNNNWIVRPSA